MSNEIYITSENKRLRGDHGMIMITIMIMMMMMMVMMMMVMMMMTLIMIIMIMIIMMIIMIILIISFDLKRLIRKVSDGKNFITMFRCHPNIIIK